MKLTHSSAGEDAIRRLDSSTMRLVELLHEEREQQQANIIGGVLKGILTIIYIIMIKQITLAM